MKGKRIVLVSLFACLGMLVSCGQKPAKHRHSLVEHEAVAATCTEEGSSLYYSCEGCGKYFSDAQGQNEIEENSWVVAALGHDLHEHAAVNPTCTEPGNSLYYTCSRCDKHFSDAEAQHEIQENSWVIPATGHTLTHHDGHEATCTEAGNIEYWTCDVCEKYYSDSEGQTEISQAQTVINALGHNLTRHPAVDPTCVDMGNSEYYSCDRCNKYFSDAQGQNQITANSWLIPATGHSTVLHEAHEATCTEAGNSAYYSCEHCSRYFSDEEGQHQIEANSWIIPALGHDLLHHDGHEATCEQAGSSEYWSCSRCGKFFSDSEGETEIEENSWVIPATGHTLTHHDAVPATCTAEGSLEYWSCDHCEKLFLDENGTQECTAQDLVVPMEEHNYVNSAVTDKIGYFESKCSACGLSNGLTSDLMTLADIDFTQAQYGAQGGKWGTNVQPTAKTMTFEVTDGNEENEISLPKVNFGLYKIVSFTLSGNDWSARVGLQTGSYAFPYAYRAEPYSGTLSFITNGNQVNATLSCAEGTTQNLTITDSDILNGNKSVSLFMIADNAYRAITAELTTLLDACEHNYVVSEDKLGAKVCSICGDEVNYVNDLNEVDFTAAQYGAHGGKWGDNVQPTAKTMVFEALKNEEGVIYLPCINFNALGFVQFSVTCGSFAIEAGLDSGSYILPILADTSAKSTGVLTLTLNSANQLVETLTCNETSGYQQKIIDDVEVINGNESVCLYMLCPDYEWQTVTCELTGLSASCEHNFAADSNCIGKESCTVCGEARGVAPTIDFTANLYGAYDIYLPMGDYEQSGWTRADSASQISYANYEVGGLCKYHLPKMYFAGFSSVSIDVTVNYTDVIYALDESFTTSYTTPFAGYSLKVVFENITASSMDVKILDAFGTTQVQATCTDANVLNGLDGYVLYVQGSGNVGWDAFSNFTFTA